MHQIPGGMISNLRSQLSQQKALDRLNEVLEEVPKVRADLGYPPLVTPTSQIVGTQAVINVLSGERYKIIPNEIKNYLKGLYGRPPAPIEPEFLKRILGDEKQITHRPADDIPPMLPTAIENLDSRLIEHEEDIISYCLFPEPALEYFKWRSLPPGERPETPADLEIKAREEAPKETVSPAPPMPPQYVRVSSGPTFMTQEDYWGLNEILKTVNSLGIQELVIRKGDESIVLKAGSVVEQGATGTQTFVSTGIEMPPRVEAAPAPEKEAAQPVEAPSYTTINSPLVGQFYTAPSPGKPPFIHQGDTVKAGDTVGIVEAMKLINEIKAPADCTIVKILIEDGKNVEKGQPLIAIEEL